MAGYALRRVLIAIPTLIRDVDRDLPDGPADAGQRDRLHHRWEQTLSPEQRHQMEHQLGLDQSYLQQYLHWIKGIAHRGHGQLARQHDAGRAHAAEAIPITAEIVVFGLVIALVFAIPLGVLSAVRPDSFARLRLPRRRRSSASASRTSGSRRCC